MKFVLSIVVALLLSVFAFGQALAPTPTNVDRNGVPATGLVTICATNPGSGTCTSLVTTYTDATLTQPCIGNGEALSGQPSWRPAGTACSNPGNADAAGNVLVFAKPGSYWCQYNSTGIAYSLPCNTGTSTGGGGGTTINPTNAVLPVRSNATTFIDSPLAFSNGSSTAARGISFTDPTITQGGTPGTTFYIYCVVATDVFTNTRSTCFDTALGSATLNSTNFNTVTVAPYSSTSPYIQPTGSCNVYRTFSGGTPSSLGKIGTIASCASGGSLNDTGLAGDATAVPIDNSGVLTSTGPANLGQSWIYSDEVSLYVIGGIPAGTSPTTVVTPGYTHDVIIAGTGAAAYANSGITAVGWDGTGNGHACTAIGYGTACNSDDSIFAGIGAGGTGGTTVGIGKNASTSAANAIAIGAGSIASSGSVIAIGQSANASHTNSVVLGKNAVDTAVNQVILGGPNVTDLYPGSVSGSGGTANIHGLGTMVSGNWSCFSVTPVTVNANVATDQNLMACSVPAGVLNRVGETLRIHTKSVYSTPAASAATLTFKAKLCDVSGCASGNVATLVSITSTANAGSITSDPVIFDAESTTQTGGVSSRYEASGDLLIDLAATTTAAATVFNDTNTAVIAGAPSDINIGISAVFIQITVAFSVASASNSVTERQLIVDTVN